MLLIEGDWKLVGLVQDVIETGEKWEREVQHSRKVTTFKNQTHREIYFEISEASSCVQVQKAGNEETTEEIGPGK